MKLSLLGEYNQIYEEIESPEDTISTEDFEKFEKGIGTLYILGTNLFTKGGKEIVKIGITTGVVEDRINQLYNTSVPYRFRLIQQFETTNYAELEQAMHKIFDPFRINSSREFFTEECLEFIDNLLEIHRRILEMNNN